MLKLDVSFVLPARTLFIRNLFFVLLLVLEVCILTIRFDTQSFVAIDLPLLNFLGYSGDFLKFGIGVVGAFIVLSISRLKIILSLFRQARAYFNYKAWFLVHLVLMAALYGLSYSIFEVLPQDNISSALLVNIAIISWLLIGVFLLISWLLMLAPPASWRQFIRQEKKSIGILFFAGFITWFISQLSEMAWGSLADLTFWTSYYALKLIYSDVFFDVANKRLGTSSFKVIIDSQCSGYEGIGLVVVFLSVYLWTARDQLRFPQVYLLFPLGISAIWLLNALRIAVLIAIGSSWSKDIAVGGFHSNAGWIAFVFISVALVLICQHITFFNKGKRCEKPRSTGNSNLATVLLLPFVVLLASLLVTSIFISTFDWLYPLRVIITGSVLWFFRRHYLGYIRNVSVSSVFIGLLVFVGWVLLVPSSESANKIFSGELFGASPTVVNLWLIFRIIGAVIMIPIIEELAFRGYLIAKLIDRHFEGVKTGQFTWLSFLLSSLLFGLLHGEWLAGTLAGMCFAFALYRRGEIFDAVIAHMTTNILLACYVLFTDSWSLW